MLPARLNIVTLGAMKMAELRAFYRSLGWSENPGSDDAFATFDTAGAILALFPYDALQKDAGFAIPALRHGTPVALSINVEERDQVDAAIESARAAGATITREPGEASWGGRFAYFSDPEANIWEVAWNPHVTFDERGALIWGS